MLFAGGLLDSLNGVEVVGVEKGEVLFKSRALFFLALVLLHVQKLIFLAEGLFLAINFASFLIAGLQFASHLVFLLLLFLLGSLNELLHLLFLFLSQNLRCGIVERANLLWVEGDRVRLELLEELVDLALLALLLCHVGVSFEGIKVGFSAPWHDHRGEAQLVADPKHVLKGYEVGGYDLGPLLFKDHSMLHVRLLLLLLPNHVTPNECLVSVGDSQ